jgi:hypothetical protein
VTTIRCPSCSAVSPELETKAERVCPACFKTFEVIQFPAFAQERMTPPVIELKEEGESACFFHPNYRPQIPCDQCGRFLCTLCAIEFGKMRLCPECIHASRLGRTSTGLNHQAILYDNLALSLVLLPLFFFFYATIATAPAGLFVSIFYFNRQQTLVARGRFRFVIAAILAIIEIAGAILLVVWLFAYLKSRSSVG